MAEYKQYITQIEENGNVLISEEVVAVIAEHALSEVEGAAGFNVKPGNEVADLIGVKNWGKGLKIMIAEDNSVAIDCDILISYGYGERRNVFCNDTACSDNAALADCNSRKNYDIRTYPDILFYADWL